MMHTVTVTNGGRYAAGGAGGAGRETVLAAENGENLFRLLRRSNIGFTAPCGGGKRCGKCAVRVESGAENAPPPDAGEIALLGGALIGGGYRLACYIEVAGDMTVTLAPSSAAAAKIITAGISQTLPLDPYVKKYALDLQKRTLENQAPDAEHIAGALADAIGAGAAPYNASTSTENAGAAQDNASTAPDIAGTTLDGAGTTPDSRSARPLITPDVFSDIGILRKLPAVISNAGGRVTCVTAGGKVTGVEPGDTAACCYGIAFDIGTTTIAGYLYDLTDGRLAAVASSLNPQSGYGADVISRINYTMSSDAGLAEMRDCVLNELNALIGRLTTAGAIGPNDVYSVFTAGNTTMLHFFMGLPAEKISVSPFLPVTTGMCVIAQPQSGLGFNEAGAAVCVPGVSAYVGADTLAAMLACGMDARDGLDLLIDIGTNGEIVIGGGGLFYACSTAAGPAFEGASISNGVGGVEGAVDAIEIAEDGGVAYTTIGGAKAIGICGSGLVDAVAQLLARSVIDETGRLLDADEAADAGAPAPLAERLITKKNGQRAVNLVPAGESAEPEGINLTQKDIRELQNAKASIAAGIKTLLKKAGKKPGDVGGVYLAGGFGNCIGVQSALGIGLIPAEFAGKVVPAGNAAGAGASSALLSGQGVARLLEMARKTRYIELSASADFTDAYIDCMTFE